MEDLQKAVIKFRDERNWSQFHNAKNLAISLNLEASELLETFQWKSSEEAIETKMQEMKEEVADVMIYLLMLSDKLTIDLQEVVHAKLVKNAEKYPVEKAFGSNKKYNEL
ncbi:nucleotide pyrophosphohydrolase [Bacillus cereus]|uniref:nucleotide pyrophosphohydrolase n=1 Tax=Bacillus cereus TaxID=1396 RepID=UPI000BF56ABA|nr:nucleotide pyrophosphohydrolase [Bacillus cereus]PFD40213.1 nucleotide pyrophosphohydrolase [Bacillus cereus]PFH82814.1 nucleotide pyrophosphohydrolase [Bacillus cereus]